MLPKHSKFGPFSIWIKYILRANQWLCEYTQKTAILTMNSFTQGKTLCFHSIFISTLALFGPSDTRKPKFEIDCAILLTYFYSVIDQPNVQCFLVRKRNSNGI